MPYVAVAPSTRQARLSGAAARWDALLAGRPDLAPAILLQRGLIGLIVDLADTFEHARLPRLSLPPRYLAAKLESGIPALAGEPLPLPVAALKPTLLALCDELSRGGAGEPADHIRSVLESAEMDAGSLLASSLARDQKAIRTGAAHRGLAADLLWLVAELAVCPFAHALQQSVFGGGCGAELAARLAAWRHGYCPACGSWPALGEAVAARRVLRCSFCALAWELPATACIYCGEAGERFTSAAPDPARSDHRIELCAACGAYLKTVDVPALTPFPLLAIADLETMELDMAAMERGYSRPQLKEFARPSGSHR